MKKWIILLSILLGTSAVGSGVVLGKIYKQEMRTYESQLESPLKKESLKNIYIEADVPIMLKTTSGEPRIEFNSILSGIVDKEPEYTLDVNEEGDTSYINLKVKGNPTFSLFLRDIETLATIYLPQQDIDQLSIKTDNYYWINGGMNLYYNINDINVNNLKIEAYGAEIDLNGNYKKINIDQEYGTVTINSKIPAEVVLRGNAEVNLKGQYQLIDMSGYGGETNIDSEIPTEVSIGTISNGTTKLKGKYKTIDIDSQYGDLWIQSDTECDVFISGQGNVELQGKFKNIDMRSEYSSVNIVNTMVPERMNLLGRYEDVFITLPENIPGFEVTYQKDYIGEQSIYTDFEVKRGIQEQTVEKVYYGTDASKIRVEGCNDKIYILEGKLADTSDTKIE